MKEEKKINLYLCKISTVYPTPSLTLTQFIIFCSKSCHPTTGIAVSRLSRQEFLSLKGWFGWRHTCAPSDLETKASDPNKLGKKHFVVMVVGSSHAEKTLYLFMVGRCHRHCLLLNWMTSVKGQRDQRWQLRRPWHGLPRRRCPPPSGPVLLRHGAPGCALTSQSPRRPSARHRWTNYFLNSSY
jgi:hypothetical protein